MKTKTNTKAGQVFLNHNQTALRIRTSVKAGGFDSMNHSQSFPRPIAGDVHVPAPWQNSN